MSSDIISDSIESLQRMQKEESVNYDKIYNIIDILKGSGELNEATSLLFDLLLKENFKSTARIGVLSKVNAGLCLNCRSNQFTQYVVDMDVKQNISGFGMKQGESTGDLIVDVCRNCNFCKFMKPKYWD